MVIKVEGIKFEEDIIYIFFHDEINELNLLFCDVENMNLSNSDFYQAIEQSNKGNQKRKHLHLFKKGINILSNNQTDKATDNHKPIYRIRIENCKAIFSKYPDYMFREDQIIGNVIYNKDKVYTIDQEAKLGELVTRYFEITNPLIDPIERQFNSYK